MGQFVKGDVVVIPFPYSDLSQAKRRPALVVADLSGDDLILCQITSQTIKDKYSVLLSEDDFISGNLNKESNIRPNKLFTADSNIILYKIGSIESKVMIDVTNKIIGLLQK